MHSDLVVACIVPITATTYQPAYYHHNACRTEASVVPTLICCWFAEEIILPSFCRHRTIADVPSLFRFRWTHSDSVAKYKHRVAGIDLFAGFQHATRASVGHHLTTIKTVRNVCWVATEHLAYKTFGLRTAYGQFAYKFSFNFLVSARY